MQQENGINKKELNENGINVIKLTDSKIIDNANYTGFLQINIFIFISFY